MVHEDNEIVTAINRVIIGLAMKCVLGMKNVCDGLMNMDAKLLVIGDLS